MFLRSLNWIRYQVVSCQVTGSWKLAVFTGTESIRNLSPFPATQHFQVTS
jgi:hypothetical protein